MSGYGEYGFCKPGCPDDVCVAMGECAWRQPTDDQIPILDEDPDAGGPLAYPRQFDVTATTDDGEPVL